jgi:hypothetical protein
VALGQKIRHFFGVIDMFEEMLAEDAFHGVVRKWQTLTAIVLTIDECCFPDINIDPAGFTAGSCSEVHH